MSRSNVIYYPTADSTNRVLREYSENGYEGLTVVAGEQTQGKGRMGRSFLSPKGGLYMSVLLKPQSHDFSLITAAAAVAVSDVLEKRFGIVCGIKWVNDIIYNEKKLCGILAESIFDNACTPKAVILGIGINLKAPEKGFPKEIADIATDIGVSLSTDEKIDLAAEIARAVTDIYPRPETFTDIYRQKSAVTGKDIWVIRNGERFSAKCIGFDESCGLIADFGNRTETLRSGEISIRIK